MTQELLEKYGNEYTIEGIVVGNATYRQLILFPEANSQPINGTMKPSHAELKEIFDQLDTLQITGINKIVLRKSQRNIEQGITWEVFRRDNYTCRYCGANDVPMTVDHIVTWESLGDSVAGNLMCACRKCNKTRGNTEYPDWLNSDYYKEKSKNFSPLQVQNNLDAWKVAEKIPLRDRKRNR